ncbi:MAG: dihydrodipicolinate synthase family protein, partial [Cellvibrio sp.]
MLPSAFTRNFPTGGTEVLELEELERGTLELETGIEDELERGALELETGIEDELERGALELETGIEDELERGALELETGIEDELERGALELETGIEDELERQLVLADSVSAQGVVALGVFGEADALTRAEQQAVVRTVTTASDLPVVLGLSSRTTAVAVDQALSCLEAAERAPRALMVQVNSPRAEALVQHLTAIHEATGLPIVVQDYPAASGVTVAADVLVEVVRACDG